MIAVELQNAEGETLLAVTIDAATPPGAITCRAIVFVATGDVKGSGRGPLSHVYRRVDSVALTLSNLTEAA